MAAHRFWRLYITGNGGHTNVTVGELELATTPGGPQAAVGGVPAASTEFSATYSVTKAFDGSSTGAWVSGANTSYSVKEYIQYDLGAGKAIDVKEVRITFPADFTATSYPASFLLLHSDDGLDWKIQRAWSGQTFTAGETKSFDTEPIPASQQFNRVVLDKAIRYNLAANVGEPTERIAMHRAIAMFAHATRPVRTTPWSGSFYIAGNTTVLGAPIARRVDLVEQRSGLLVRSLTTDDDGAFLFDHIGPGPWTVIGVDSSAEQNSVIYAHVTPSPMT